METKIKDRGWVKNAAIILLAVLLVLTFFSNTIMNRSLPEVATQSIRAGTITAQIRGSGTVTASAVYEVKVSQSRKVQSVLVKAGQEVQAGDTLFVLASDSKELEEAENRLRELRKSYQTTALQNAAGDYAQEERDIRLAQEALTEAEEKLENMDYDPEALPAAEAALEEAKAAVETAKGQLDALARQLQEMGIYGELDAAKLLELRQSMKSRENAYNAAKSALQSAMLTYNYEYKWVIAQAEYAIRNTRDYHVLTTDREREAMMEELLPAYAKYITEQVSLGVYDETMFYEGYDAAPGDRHMSREAIIQGYQAVTEAQEALKKAEEEYLSQDSSLTDILNRADPALQTLEKAEKQQTQAQQALEKEKTKKDEYNAAVETVKTCQKTLEDLQFALAERRKSDNRQSQLAYVELQDLAEQIEKQEQLVAELTDGSAINEVTADVGGLIGSVSITAGNTTTPDGVMATIEVPDMGYTLSFSVSNDQARRVHVGDTASAANVYWGSQIDAVLTGIRTNPQDPQNSKLLTFDVTGDVTPGSKLTLSVGQRGTEYDYVVPNSALRSDSNGDFILVVTVKNSPLGDRYTATRVNVTKLAADDTATAVSGGLNVGDFVITTSTAPIKNGDRVRLADNQNSN